VASFVPELLRVLVPKAYAGAAIPAVWLAFAAVALGAYTVTAIGIGLALRTPLLGLSAGGALAVAVAANAVLTPRFGGPGAGIATFLGYATAAALTYRVAQHVRPHPFRGGRALLVFGLALGLALVSQRVGVGGVPGAAIKLVMAAAFAATCLALKLHRDQGAVAPGFGSAGTRPTIT